MLKVKDINVYYGKIHALKNVSFEVRPGEVVALIGANGAGKSTTLKTVSGMMHSRTGSIEFLGEDITHTPSHNLVYKGLAHVPEGRRIFQQMTVLENLEMGAYLHKKPTREELKDIFTRFPRLQERRDQVAGTLSGGESQRVSLARGVMAADSLLILDEALASLDPPRKARLLEQIAALPTLIDVPVLMITHSPAEALRVSEKAIGLSKGQIAATGDTRSVLESCGFLKEEGNHA